MIRNERLVRSIAEDRIERLFELAKQRTVQNRGSDPLSKRYVSIAEAIVRHYKVAPGSHLKNEVCKGCKSVLVPGINCSVRLANSRGYVVVVCGCGEEKHIFYR